MLSLYSWITVILWVACFAWLALGAKSPSQQVRVYDQKPGLARALKLLYLLGMFALIYKPGWFGLASVAAPKSHIRGLLGVAFCATGIALIVVARRVLGRNWSDLVVLKQDHQLVQSGPYRWMRHPLYSGLLLALLGSALTVGGGAGYAITGCCFIGLLIKSRKEEQLLAREFPTYGEYRHHVRAFVPFVF